MIEPKLLKTGSKIALISTARKVSVQEMKFAISVFQSWGLEVVEGKNLYQVDNQFAGTDAERISDLQWALDNPEIEAIVCVRGGYGTARIIDHIDFTGFKKNPKWIVGFSDVTVLHCHLQNMGYCSIHAIMPILFENPKAQPSIESLKEALFNKNITYPQRYTLPEAEIVGGNLSIVHNLIGTKSDIDTTDKILFLEDIDEYFYHIDRMINHLERANKLSNLKALVIGYFTDLKDNSIPFGKSVKEIILDNVSKYNYPVLFDFQAGHDFDNLAIVFGRKWTKEEKES